MNYSDIVFRVPKTKYTEKLGIAGRKGKIIDVWHNGKFVVRTDAGDFPIYEIPPEVKMVVEDVISSQRDTSKEAENG